MLDAYAGADENGDLPVVLRGDIDFTGSAGILQILQASAGQATGANVGVDLAEVTFMDSSGIAVLVFLLHVAQARGGQLRLVNVSQKVQDQLHLAGLSQLLGSSAGGPSWLGPGRGVDGPPR